MEVIAEIAVIVAAAAVLLYIWLRRRLRGAITGHSEVRDAPVS